MSTNYNKQATDFLQATNTTLEVKEANPQKPAQWGSGEDKTAHKHISYSVTLKNAKHSYTFDFWGSINDWEKVDQYTSRSSIDSTLRKEIAKQAKRADIQSMTNEQIKKALLEIVKPSEYDILACLSPMSETLFDDWCASFGYDTDSRNAYDIYMRCVEQDRNLYRLFTHEELEQLAEIN